MYTCTTVECPAQTVQHVYMGGVTVDKNYMYFLKSELNSYLIPYRNLEHIIDTRSELASLAHSLIVAWLAYILH